MAAFLSPGDHVLITDSAYTPTKKSGQKNMENVWGSIFHIFLATLRKNQTISLIKLSWLCLKHQDLYLSSYDIPMIAEVAHKHNAVVAIDIT